MMERSGRNKELFEQSGEVSFPNSDNLISLMYYLLRDVAPAGSIERAIRQVEEEKSDEIATYTNGYLARYAKYLADRIRVLANG